MAEPRQTHAESAVGAREPVRVGMMSVHELVELKHALEDRWGAAADQMADPAWKSRMVMGHPQPQVVASDVRHVVSESEYARASLLGVVTRRIEQLAVQEARERQKAVATSVTSTREWSGRQMQAMISSAALGGGMLLAGFGLVPALVGAAVGASLAYWLESRAAMKSYQRAA